MCRIWQPIGLHASTHLCCIGARAFAILVLLTQVEKAPLESYADVGGLEQQVIEIKEAVELPLTHPELYQDIGIKPPKVRHLSSKSYVVASVTMLCLSIGCLRLC